MAKKTGKKKTAAKPKATDGATAENPIYGLHYNGSEWVHPTVVDANPNEGRHFNGSEWVDNAPETEA